MRRSATIAVGLILIISMLGPAYGQVGLSSGQTVYLPVYSHVLLGSDRRPQEETMSTMLSIRNTNKTSGIEILSVEYYDTEGKKIREYADKPFVVKPMATKEFFIGADDKTGGSGANFLIVWKSTKPVHPPIIEGLHCSWRGQLGLSFVTVGKVLE